MSHPPTAEDEFAVLQRAFAKRRQTQVVALVEEPANLGQLQAVIDDCEQQIRDLTGVSLERLDLSRASGPATRGSGEAEKRDRGGEWSRSSHELNPVKA